MKKGKSYGEVKSGHKMLDVLEFVADGGGKTTSQEIADGVGMPLGTVMMHITTLEKRGYLRQTDAGWGYGPKVAGHWARYRRVLETTIDDAEKELKRIGVS